MTARLLLASGSPRRRELLERLGLEFDMAAPDIDETPLPGEDPIAYVRRLALEAGDAFKAHGAVRLLLGLALGRAQ